MQVFAVGLDLEAMALAALDDFARARLGAEQAVEIRARCSPPRCRGSTRWQASQPTEVNSLLAAAPR